MLNCGAVNFRTSARRRRDNVSLSPNVIFLLLSPRM